MKTSLFNLDGKTAVVTGASRGIGEAIALLFAQQGAHVVVSSRKKAACDAVVRKIVAAGGSAESVACHVGNLDEIDGIVEHVKTKHQKLNILVNNAAANPFFGHILDTDLGAYQKTVDVNIRGYFFMSVAAGRLMRNTGGGVIVNTASVNALHPGDRQGIYSISKAAVVNMTKAFAKECAGAGIRCNAVLPGLTKTKFAGALFDDPMVYQSALAAIPMRRHADSHEIAGAALFLASDAASYTTGECIVVDGGATA